MQSYFRYSGVPGHMSGHESRYKDPREPWYLSDVSPGMLTHTPSPKRRHMPGRMSAHLNGDAWWEGKAVQPPQALQLGAAARCFYVGTHTCFSILFRRVSVFW